MKEYYVKLKVECVEKLLVSANSEEEAKEKVLNMYDAYDLSFTFEDDNDSWVGYERTEPELTVEEYSEETTI